MAVHLSPVTLLVIGLLTLVLLALWTYRSASVSAGLSPHAVFIPVFVLYNSVAILIAHPSSASYQWLMVAAGVVAYWAGLSAARDTSSARRQPAGRPAPIRVSRRVSAALLVVTVLVFGFLTARSGLPILAADPNSARVTFFPNGYLSTLAVVPATSLLALSLLVLITAQRWHKQRFEIGCALVVGLLLFATANRGLLAAPLLTVVLYRAWNKKYKIGRLLLIGLLAFTAFSYTGYVRNRNDFGPTYDRDLAQQGFEGPSRYLAPALLYVAGSSQILDKTIHEFPGHTPFALGTQFFSPLLLRPSVDLYLKEHFHYNFVGFGVAPGVLTAFYLDWGFPGIIAGFFVGGALAGTLHRKARLRGPRLQLAYVSLLSSMLLSNYGHPFAYLSYLLIPALTIWAVKEPKTRTIQSSAQPLPRQIASY